MTGPDEALVRDWRAPFPVDVRMTLSVHRRGGGDPAYRVDAAGAVWRTSLTPEGPATLRILPARFPMTASSGGPASSVGPLAPARPAGTGRARHIGGGLGARRGLDAGHAARHAGR